ncbi:MAG: RNase adapter RapZ [Clostridia bacterium]|nr:RNase adapter RapZ [Clostridia bacterium]
MNILIITGMSGAGKSQAANVLEDMGYYCVDNIPPAIIPEFVKLSEMGNESLKKIAIVTDIRGGKMFSEIPDVLSKLKQKDIDLKILFLDANNETLENRYRENRRTHPLCDTNGMSLSEAVASERSTLAIIRGMSDFIIDTSNLSPSQLKVKIPETLFGDKSGGIKILCKSFGFKYGIDNEADLVIDVRCLPNPFYIEELKHKTGLQKEVRDYILSFEESREFEKKVFDLINFAVPLYIKEGKSRLVIDFGCTGGKHRSVTFAEACAKYLKESGYAVKTIHRDIEK